MKYISELSSIIVASKLTMEQRYAVLTHLGILKEQHSKNDLFTGLTIVDNYLDKHEDLENEERLNIHTAIIESLNTISEEMGIQKINNVIIEDEEEKKEDPAAKDGKDEKKEGDEKKDDGKGKSSFGKVINSKDLSQQEIADAIGVNKSTISRYNTGSRVPSFDTLEKLANFGNVRAMFPELS